VSKQSSTFECESEIINPGIIFPIKKRNNTELIIGGTATPFKDQEQSEKGSKLRRHQRERHLWLRLERCIFCLRAKLLLCGIQVWE